MGMAGANRISDDDAGSAAPAAGSRLLRVYAALAGRGEHLFEGLLQGEQPRQWAHYPEDDAIDADNGYQWFYHSHAPEDRPGGAEHGHIHLFARQKRWSGRTRSRRDREFAQFPGRPVRPGATRHLLSIDFNAKGIPVSLFTVNSWVTGDLMLNADTTAKLLKTMVLRTDYPAIDAVIESVVALYLTEIRELLHRRDQVLFGHTGADVLADEALEVLSKMTIDIDAKLRGLDVRLK